ncbi:MAG: hypothetical protein U9M98_00190 [Patescibacteria group bacterium]|nr:hypothetical protein [Patescibacteria group bacterium]
MPKAKVVVNSKVHLENFDNIPVLTKEIIRTQGKNLYPKDYKQRGFYENTSGGSTGEPVRFIQDKTYDEINKATKIYLFKKFGKDIGKPEIKFWGSDRDIIEGTLTLKDKIINFLYNRRFFNTYDLDKGKFDELIELHNCFQPTAYWAYVDAMEEFADYILENNISVYSPKIIVTTIGPLYEKARKKIEKAFSCSVYNQYGSREVGWIAFENKSELDVCFWRQFLELKGKSKEKKIILTSLDNYSMPLIRYDIGDVAALGESYSIGKTKSYLTIGNVVGRTLGFFKLRDGSLKHTHFIVQQLFFRDWIKQFQLIQQNYNKILIKIVGKENKEEMKEIDKLLFDFLGNEFEIKWEFVDKIPPTKSGKYLYTISKVK